MEKLKELTVGDYIIIAKALDGKRQAEQILKEIGQDKIDRYYEYFRNHVQGKKESKDLTDEEMIITKEDMLSATLEAEFMKSLREGQKGDYPQYLEGKIKEYTSELLRLAREHK